MASEMTPAAPVSTTLSGMLVSRSGLSPIMVGRDAELTTLTRSFAALDGDAPQVVIVTGEAGVGKTRLLREFAAAVSPTPVLAGHAEEGDLGRPFELLRDALEAHIAAWSATPAELSSRAHTIGHVLSPLLTEHEHDNAHDHTLDELLRAGVDVVRHVVGGRPTVLLFEDLHWADAESVGLFTLLATTPGLPVLLVGTFRPEDFDRRHPLATALPALERQRTVTHLTLGRLSTLDLTGMLEAVFARPVPTTAVSALHARTQGNPFFVEELVATCDCVDPADLATAPLPWNVAEAVMRRVDELAPDERRVLDTAALLGSRIPFDLLANVSGVAEDALIAMLHTLMDRGMLVEQDADLFGFRHALTREAVASQLLGREQRRVHEAALAALRAQGSDDLAALARHAAGAGRWDDLARYAAVGAARALREGSGPQALRLAELGLSRAEEAPARDELGLRATAAAAAFNLGLLDVAARHAEQWRLVAVEEKDREQESAALRQLALLRRLDADPAGHRELLAKALAVAEELGESEELAWCLAYQAQYHMLEDEQEEAIAWADRALALADAIDCPRVRASALVNKGTALTESPGGSDEGLALLMAAKQEALEQRDISTALRALNNAVVHLLFSVQGGGDRGKALVAEGHQLTERYGVTLYAAKFAAHAVELALAEGDLDLAETHLARGLREVTETEESLMLAATDARRAVERDDLTRAEAILDRVTVQVSRLRGTYVGASMLLAALNLRVRQGDQAAVAALLTELRDGLSANPRWGGWSNYAAVIAAPDAPLELLTALSESTAQASRREAKGPGHRAHAGAIVAERKGDFEAAARLYRESLSDRTVRPAFVVASAHQGLARCLAQLGERAEARQHAQTAVDLLARWPGWRRAAAEGLLRRLGGGDHAGEGLLTRREVEVVELLAQGLTNREVADRLFIATKTAAVHVSNILAKTGLGSRTEVATWAVGSGLVNRAPDDRAPGVQAPGDQAPRGRQRR